MNTNEIELAYLAGAMDADGFFTIIRMCGKRGKTGTFYVETVGLTQVPGTVAHILRDRFGGVVTVRTRKGNHATNWKPTHYWVGTNKNAARTIHALRPYLKIKQKQADLLLEMRQSKTLPRTVRIGVRSSTHSDAVKSDRERIYTSVRALNKTGMADLVMSKSP